MKMKKKKKTKRRWWWCWWRWWWRPDTAPFPLDRSLISVHHLLTLSETLPARCCRCRRRRRRRQRRRRCHQQRQRQRRSRRRPMRAQRSRSSSARGHVGRPEQKKNTQKKKRKIDTIQWPALQPALTRCHWIERDCSMCVRLRTAPRFYDDLLSWHTTVALNSALQNYDLAATPLRLPSF